MDDNNVISFEEWRRKYGPLPDVEHYPLRDMREDMGLTMRQLAMMMNMDVSWLAQVERGQRSVRIEHLEAFAKALGVPVERIVGAVT